MIAEPGKTYAQMMGNIVHWIFTSQELPEWNNNTCPAIDVTGIPIMIGDVYDPITNAFSTPIPINKIIPNAKILLDSADAVALRCFTAGVPYPTEWQTYKLALRAIVSGTDITSTVLPTKPAYPEGT